MFVCVNVGDVSAAATMLLERQVIWSSTYLSLFRNLHTLSLEHGEKCRRALKNFRVSSLRLLNGFVVSVVIVGFGWFGSVSSCSGKGAQVCVSTRARMCTYSFRLVIFFAMESFTVESRFVSTARSFWIFAFSFSSSFSMRLISSRFSRRSSIPVFLFVCVQGDALCRQLC